MTDKTLVERLSHREQMLDAQKGCVPCRLCGGSAVISDAGPGSGYYIRCANGEKFNKSSGCLIGDRRLGGWAYNVMEWWNRLHAPTPAERQHDDLAEAQREARLRRIDLGLAPGSRTFGIVDAALACHDAGKEK